MGSIVLVCQYSFFACSFCLQYSSILAANSQFLLIKFSNLLLFKDKMSDEKRYYFNNNKNNYDFVSI